MVRRPVRSAAVGAEDVVNRSVAALHGGGHLGKPGRVGRLRQPLAEQRHPRLIVGLVAEGVVTPRVMHRPVLEGHVVQRDPHDRSFGRRQVQVGVVLVIGRRRPDVRGLVEHLRRRRLHRTAQTRAHGPKRGRPRHERLEIVVVNLRAADVLDHSGRFEERVPLCHAGNEVSNVPLEPAVQVVDLSGAEESLDQHEAVPIEPFRNRGNLDRHRSLRFMKARPPAGPVRIRVTTGPSVGRLSLLRRPGLETQGERGIQDFLNHDRPAPIALLHPADI